MPPTHEVFNQPPALDGYDVADDPAMLAALRREGAEVVPAPRPGGIDVRGGGGITVAPAPRLRPRRVASPR